MNRIPNIFFSPSLQHNGNVICDDFRRHSPNNLGLVTPSPSIGLCVPRFVGLRPSFCGVNFRSDFHWLACDSHRPRLKLY